MTFLRTCSEDELKSANRTLTHISLFTGCGGFDLGMSMAGFESRVMVEWDKACCETLRANWHWKELKKRTDGKGNPLWKSPDEINLPHYHKREPVILQEDITKLSTEKILEAADLKVGEATVVTGGPPCQGFSTAGKRMIDDPRNILFKEFVRVVREALPKFFIFENVPGLVSMAKGEIIKQICEEFANCGYDVSWRLLNAANYGVPQRRIRVIIIGKRIDLMYFPERGNPQLHMGAIPGEVDHPENFRKKHNMPLKNQATLPDFKEPETVEELLRQTMKRNRGEND